MDDTRQQLRQAFDLIKAGDKAGAVSILTPIIKRERDNADAWWLMANAVDNPDFARRALQEVLRLQPGHPAASARLDKLRAAPPAAEDDPFADTDAEADDPFAEFRDDSAPARRAGKAGAAARRGSGVSPLLWVLVIIGVLLVVGCAAIFYAVSSGMATLGQAVGQMVAEVSQNVTVMPDGSTVYIMPDGTPVYLEGDNPFAPPGILPAVPVGTPVAIIPDLSAIDFGASGDGDLGAPLPNDVVPLGGINFTQAITGQVDNFAAGNAYTFYGEAGTTVTIDLLALDDQIDPKLQLYGVANTLVAENDDIEFMENRNSSIRFTLPESGTYTIVATCFDLGGQYQLTLN